MRIYTFLFAFFFTCNFIQVNGQPNSIFRVPKIPFIVNGNEVENPLGGNWGNPVFSQIDLNNDGLKDLYVFDRANNRSLTFINKNTNNPKTNYSYQYKYESYFPKDMTNFALLRDYTGDSLEDIFAYTSGGLKVYKAARKPDNSIEFTKVTDLLFSENYDNWGGTVNIWVSYTDMPAIVDIDYDGDMDIMAISLLDNKISLYKSMVKEKKLPMDSLDYKYQALCWGKFSMQFMPLDMLKNTCGGDTIDAIAPPRTPKAGSRHGGNTIWVFDEDKDKDYEVLLGDVAYNYGLYGKNDGNLKIAKMLQSSIVYPSYSKPIDKLFPMGYWMDVDNDGNKDMIVTAHDQSINQGNKKAAFYKNIPKGDTSKFIYQTDSFMFDHLIDFGKGARPVFIDYNFDSMMDIIVSNDFNFDTPSNLFSTLSLFKNTGTKKFPKYTLVNSNYANIKSIWQYNVHPCFGDINRDSIPDMIFGTGGGAIYFAQGVKTNNELTFPTIQILFSKLNDVLHTHPHLADIDGDKKLDLLVGDLDGNIQYIPSRTNATWPFFDTSKVNLHFGNVNVADSLREIYFDLYASPTVYSIDSTKTPNLFVSNMSGEIFQFKINPDSLSKGSFKRISKDIIPDRFKERTNIAMADLNRDGAMEILIGTEAGGLNLYSFAKFDSTADSVVIIKDPNSIQQFTSAKYAVYPNPTSGLVYIQLAHLQMAQVEVYDEIGKLRMAQEIESNGSISLANLPKGLYILRIRMGDEIFYEKIIAE